MVSCLWNLYLLQGHSNFLSSISFIVLSFTFRSKIHFELIFVWCRVCLKFTFFLLYIQKSKKSILSTWNYLWTFVENQLSIQCIGLFMDCSIDLPIFVPIQKVDVLESGSVSYLNFFFYKVYLAILNFWHFHLNFRICFFQLLQWKKPQFCVGSCWIYKPIWEEPTWVGLWTHEHKVSLHLSVLYFL